jgi:hypothetical protein
MRHFAATVALVIPFLAAVACGGRVGVVGGGGDTCPAPTAVTSGGACSTAGQTCATTYDLCGTTESTDCTCTGGLWACPEQGGGCIEQCPVTNGVQPGSSCDAATQGACHVEVTSLGCDGTQLSAECACEADGQEGALWVCVQSGEPECPDAQPPGCPDPSTVEQGNGCGVSPQLSCPSDMPVYDCNGNVIGQATCQCFGGSWSCITPEPDCPPTSCPDPQNVEQGFSCASPGMQCPGNPTYCDGAVFYDAFECDQGAWNDVATTGCSGSSGSGGGGGGSSGSSSGGEPVDAGFADAKGI